MKNKKYEAVIFDLDGTLLNTLEDLLDSVNYAMSVLEMPVRSYEEIRHFVGNGIRRLLELSVPEGDKNPQFEQAFTLFKKYYGEHCNDKTDLYPGIIDLLKRLKEEGFQMAIVSNKYFEGVEALKEQYFKEYLDVAIGEREGIRKKPAPDTVLAALQELGSSKEAGYCAYRIRGIRDIQGTSCLCRGFGSGSCNSGQYGDGLYYGGMGLPHKERAGNGRRKGVCRQAFGHNGIFV